MTVRLVAGKWRWTFIFRWWFWKIEYTLTFLFFKLAVAPIDHVYGTLGIVGAKTTQEYSETSQLKSEIEGVGSFTFFAPSNDAWDLLDPVSRLDHFLYVLFS